MKHIRKRLAALLPVLALLLSLAACGGDPGSKTSESGPGELTAPVYVPQFRPAEAGGYVMGACAVGEDVYLMGMAERHSTETDPETGETSYLFQNGCALFRGTAAGGLSPAVWPGWD